jgi:hypothetical protein
MPGLLSAYPGNRPKIVSRAWTGIRFVNVVILNLTASRFRGIADASGHAGDGVWIENTAHHIRIINNEIYGFGGAGWHARRGLPVHHQQRIHGTSKLSPYANSAISLFQLLTL